MRPWRSDLDDPLSEMGYAVLGVENPVVAAKALVALDKSTLPAEIRGSASVVRRMRC